MDMYLQPGDIHFASNRTRFHTLLGSCVSITLWHPRLHIGGMCHYMLPARRLRNLPGEMDGLYADEAVAYFLREISQHATRPDEYEAKLFGGGNMFPPRGKEMAIDIAARNIESGRKLLQASGFRVLAEDVGGTAHRRVIFDLADGQVWVRQG